MTAQNTGRRVRRRSVIAAGWSTPVVVVAMAAPAFAASGGVLRFTHLNGYGANYLPSGRPTTVESQLQVLNEWGATAKTLTSLTVTLAYPDTRVGGAAPTLVSGTGWAYASVAHVGSTWVYTYTFTGSVTPANPTPLLTVRVPLINNASGSFPIVGTAAAPGFAPTTFTGSATIT